MTWRWGKGIAIRSLLTLFFSVGAGALFAEEASLPALPGDMNADGVIDGTDVTLLVRAALDPQEYCRESGISMRRLMGVADLDRNGRVEMHDVQVIKQRLENPALQTRSSAPMNSVGLFPLGVWWQSPSRAPAYSNMGINLYVCLGNAPTRAQLMELAKHKMPVICAQTEVTLQELDNPLIYAWMIPDEPDNSQTPLPGESVYRPPISPAVVSTMLQGYKRKDPVRPVLINFGQGVAWDRWHGRGIRTNHPEDYPLYSEKADILSFDFYPLSTTDARVYGEVWRIGKGIRRLVDIVRGTRKSVWAVIGTSGNSERKPAPEEIRAQVWMGVIHGARGIVYFVHQLSPTFVEAGIFLDPEACAIVERTNRRIIELAEVIKAIDPFPAPAVTRDGKQEVHYIVGGSPQVRYLFAVSMQSSPGTFRFDLRSMLQDGIADVLDEGRTLPVRSGMLTDRFSGWQAHIYRIESGSPSTSGND